jgi:hypothetical protein
LRSEWSLAAAAGLALLASAAPVRAQAPAPPAAAAATPVLLPRAGFSFGWTSLIAVDKRFDWQGRVAADFDIVDYGAGRVQFLAEYEATIGRERRRYDLNQGFYLFETTTSVRRGRVEAQALLQHVSRHLVDREQGPAISWNVVGGRLTHRWSSADARAIESDVEAGRFTQPAFVDYRWMARARVSARAAVHPRVAVIARAAGEVIGVDRRIADRTRPCGGLIEAGLRIAGRAADVEVFAGYERRVDAFATDRVRVRWFMAGFRVVSR